MAMMEMSKDMKKKSEEMMSEMKKMGAKMEEPTDMEKHNDNKPKMNKD